MADPKIQFFKECTKAYVCGPTVYDKTHLGHARTYISVDLIRRIMHRVMGLKTYFVMNITDIDDKIIKKAEAENMSWRDIALRYEKSYFESMSKLRVQQPDTIIRVSEVLPQIISYIQKIIDHGFAYISTDGSVYFDTEAYRNAGYEDNDLESDEHTEIEASILEQKKSKKDFALWKGRPESELGFDATFTYHDTKVNCRGRPGWHIECSTMIHETIGPDLDLHFGGIDLKFPHHQNERIQAHAYYHPDFQPSKKSWCQDFLHIGHLHIDGHKMSKSLKNFITIDEALSDLTPNQLRWLFMSHHWKDRIDYSAEVCHNAKILDATFQNFFDRIINYPFDKTNLNYQNIEFELNQDYYAISNNILTKLYSLEMDQTVKLLRELVSKTNVYLDANRPNESLVRKIYHWIMYMVTTLGFDYQKQNSLSEAEIMSVLVKTRNALRMLTRDTHLSKEKIFEILDQERNINLKEIGIHLIDTKDSSAWSKIN